MENSTNPAIFFILSGSIEIFHKFSLRKTETITLKNLQKGETFGEIAFFSGKARSASAKATNFTTILSLNREDFLNVLENFPDDRVKIL